MFKKLKKSEHVMSATAAELLEREKLSDFQLVIPERINKLPPLLSEAKKNLTANKEPWDGLASSGRDNIHLQVSPDNIDRAIKIMYTLLTGFEKRGFKLFKKSEHNYHQPHHMPAVEIQGVKVSFRLQERLRQTRIDSLTEIKNKNFRSRLDYNFKPGEKYLIPSGKLYLQIETDADLRCRKLWEDKDNELIENHLSEFMEGLIIASEGARLRDERWLEAEKQRQAEAEIVYKREQRIKAKQSRIDTVKSLLCKVDEYEKVQALKLRLQNKDNYQGLEKEAEQFIMWIDEYLESGDPLVRLLKNTVKPLLDGNIS